MPSRPDRLGDRIDLLMVRDRRELGRRLERARRVPADDARQVGLAELEAAVAAAEDRLARRRAAVPALRYPEELPITERRHEIAAALSAHQVVIVAGETGSGKSTQIPKICLEAGRGVRGLVGHTQPRRIAARAVAERVAEEVGTEVGGTVGYAVRFTDRVGEGTLVKVMTDGILLAEIHRDRDLLAYDTLIIDEAHERSLNIDFILGYLRQLLPRRPDLSVIVTSATIDTERFAAHFAGPGGRPAPVVEVSGRAHPVDVRYRPPAVPDGDGGERGGRPVARDQIEAISDATIELCAEGPGDILVFLSGEREIRDTAEALEALDLPSTEVLPLYARLSAAEQHRVFASHKGRRIVLATNVAETSLTVPGIRSVVDPGTARISRYNRRTKVQRLPIEAVSQASADQRAGRCGRVGPGICIRLYDEDDYLARPEFTDPEILRTSLASVILQMAAIGLGDVAAFPFLDPPDDRSIADGVALLGELGAFEAGAEGAAPRLTPLGRRLARLPLDPRLGRMVLEAERQGCLPEVMVIAAALSIVDPRDRPTDQQAAAAEAHARFADPDSDFLSYLRLWRHLADQAGQRSQNQFRKLCRAEFLNYLRVREWQDIYAQLRQATRDLGTRPAGEPGEAADQDSRDRVHRALLAGLLSHVGVRGAGPRDDYLGARDARFAIVPDSALYRKQPRWVMAGELVETNRLWGRVAARIHPEWAESLGAHLVKRTYSEPHWDATRGAAMATERVTLYGLPLVVARRVNYERVDPAAARELFIRCALVEGDWTAPHRFVADNAALVAEVRRLEDRVRRRDILVDEAARYAFYDARVPATVTGGGAFDRWWKQQPRTDARLLHFALADLVDPAAGDVGAAAFPDTWTAGGIALPLSYVFDPASPADGVTVGVPIQVLEHLDPAEFDWHVPGLRLELVTELIRSLPKEVRRNFVPAPDHAREALSGMAPGDGPLLDVLSRRLARLAGEPVSSADYGLDRLAAYLRVRFEVEDEDRRPLARSRDLDALREHLGERVAAGIAEAARALEHTGSTSWTFGVLPVTVPVDWAGYPVEAYPALVDEGESVGVAVFRTRVDQDAAMGPGLRRLVLLGVPSPGRSVLRSLPDATKLGLGRSSYPSATALLDDCVVAAADQLIADGGGPVRDEAAFGVLMSTVRAGIAGATAEIATIVGGVLAVANGIELRLERLAAAPTFAPAVVDMRAQLAGLVGRGFVSGAGPARLGHLLRYLDAMGQRLDKLAGGAGADRDARLVAPIRRLQDRYAGLLGERPAGEWPGAAHVGWMIEELRVSVFAQHLGTTQPVSEQRIAREIDRLRHAGWG